MGLHYNRRGGTFRWLKSLRELELPEFITKEDCLMKRHKVGIVLDVCNKRWTFTLWWFGFTLKISRKRDP